VLVPEATPRRRLGERVAAARRAADGGTRTSGTLADVDLSAPTSARAARERGSPSTPTREEPVPASERAVELGLAAAQAAADKLAATSCCST
jgi:hypothetical protein